MKNHKGFSVIEILSGIIVLSLIGLVGLFVFSKSNKNDPQTQTTTQSPSVKNEDTLTVAKFKKYDDTNYSFDYPVGWKLKSTSKDGTVILESEDYGKKQIPAQKGSYTEINSGYSLDVQDISNTYSNIDELISKVVQDENSLGGGTHKSITVDGGKALWVNNKFSDTFQYVVVFKDGKVIHIQLNAPDDSRSEVNELFDKILSSFVIKK